MKKKFLSLLMVGVMSGAMLTGCGENAEVTKVDETEVSVVTNETSAESAETAVEEAASETTVEEDASEATEEGESAETETQTETAAEAEEAEVSDFFSENGIEVVECAEGETVNFTFHTVKMDYSAETDVDATVTISQAPADEDGYVNTTMEVVLVPRDEDCTWWVSTYDRYTGISLESGWQEFKPGNGDVTHTDVCVINLDGVEYDCAMTYIIDNTGLNIKVTATHPADYDGVVFEFGGDNETTNAISAGIDYAQTFTVIDYESCLDPHYFKLK